MLVEDHDIGRRSLSRLLDSLGYEVTEVVDGTSALEALETQAAFDFVLTDVRLPDLDGRDVAHAAGEMVPRPRIGLMTGWDVEPEETCRLGVDWVFLKPLNVREIVAKLQPASAEH